MASLIPCLKNAKWREISKTGLGKISCVSNIPHGEADLSVFLRHNRVRVPIHFPTDPFTSEKFPPPPPFLQPKSDAGHHKVCIHGQMQQHAIFASQTLPSKTCKSRCHEVFAHKTHRGSPASDQLFPQKQKLFCVIRKCVTNSLLKDA